MEYNCRLLVVDDEPDILRTNRRYLETRGYEVDTAACAKDALEFLRQVNYDCILLDVLLPDMNGFELCEAVRSLTMAPILFVSCMDDEEDKVRGLMAGGDDYITKPYSLKELSARIYAQVRRSAARGITIDRQHHSLTVDGRVIPLSQKEFQVLLYLMGRPGRVISALELYQGIWYVERPDSGNSVAVHIGRLRKKLEGTERTIGTIETIRGEGYLFNPGLEVRTTL